MFEFWKALLRTLRMIRFYDWLGGIIWIVLLCALGDFALGSYYELEPAAGKVAISIWATFFVIGIAVRLLAPIAWKRIIHSDKSSETSL